MTSSFNMFSDAGDADVSSIVVFAHKHRLTWPETYKLLVTLSDRPNRGEAMDTAVREAVYSALKFDTSFYC